MKDYYWHQKQNYKRRLYYVKLISKDVIYYELLKPNETIIACYCLQLEKLKEILPEKYLVNRKVIIPSRWCQIPRKKSTNKN